MLCAIDVGHGYTKALSTHGGRFLFPSLICPLPARVDLGEFGQADVVTIDNQPFLVGDAARPHAIPLWTRHKATDIDTLRLMVIAVAQLGAVGPVGLATGLPLSWFGPQRKAFRESLLDTVSVVQLPGQPLQRVWFSPVKVLPQGLAAALALIVDSHQGPGVYLVADIGYRTTDYLIVTKTSGSQVHADPTQAGSLEIGTHHIAAAVAANLEREFQIPFTAAEVETAETIFANGQAVSLVNCRAHAVAAVSGQLRDRLTEILDTTLLKLTGVVLCGGGASVLRQAFPQAVIPSQSQWSNVLAYLSALQDGSMYNANLGPE